MLRIYCHLRWDIPGCLIYNSALKPFKTAEIRVRIRNLLDQREKLRKKYSGMIGMLLPASRSDLLLPDSRKIIRFVEN